MGKISPSPLRGGPGSYCHGSRHGQSHDPHRLVGIRAKKQSFQIVREEYRKPWLIARMLGRHCRKASV
jgi:hypothetical protein